jgi:hypothetical protein
MPLQYPIAANALEALDAQTGARTVGEARELARRPVTLVIDWVRPLPAEREAMQAKADAGVARGFVQLYEDAKGQPVIAVSYWKPDRADGANPRKARTKAEKPSPSAPDTAEDHTDDLYFTKPGMKAKRKPKGRDPNQLDLFGPDQKGAEYADPHNPGVVIVDEEGDGAAFGGVDQST